MNARTGEAGFTLIEMVLAMTIGGLVIGSLAAAMFLGLGTERSVQTRLAESNSANLLASYFAPDVQQSGPVTTAPTADDSPYCGAGGGPVALLLPQNNNTSSVSYFVDPTDPKILRRRTCAGGAADRPPRRAAGGAEPQQCTGGLLCEHVHDHSDAAGRREVAVHDEARRFEEDAVTRHLSPARRARGEEGVVLAWALAFLVVVGIVVFFVLGYTSTSINSSTRLANQRSALYAVDGAVNNAIRYVQNNANAGVQGGSNNVCPSPVALNSQSVSVQCTPSTDSGTATPPSSAPPFAILTLAPFTNFWDTHGYGGNSYPGCSSVSTDTDAELGIVQVQNDKALTVNGDVYVNSDVDADTWNNHCPNISAARDPGQRQRDRQKSCHDLFARRGPRRRTAGTATRTAPRTTRRWLTRDAIRRGARLRARRLAAEPRRSRHRQPDSLGARGERRRRHPRACRPAPQHRSW